MTTIRKKKKLRERDKKNNTITAEVITDNKGPGAHSDRDRLVRTEHYPTDSDSSAKDLMRKSMPVSLRTKDEPDERLVKLLENLGLEKYISIFIEEEWDWDALLEITSADLMGLGIKSGSRRKLMTAIARVREESGLHSQSAPGVELQEVSSATIKELKKDKNYIIDFKEITKQRLLGRGFYGEVFLGTWNGYQVAVKQKTRMSEPLDKWLLEIELLHNLRHPNIVTFYCACVEAPNYCIVLEYVARGSLEKVLLDPVVDISDDRRLKILADIARGIYYLHSQNPPVIHRDLKSDNVLIDDSWSAKVSDFGLSRYKDDVYNYGKASTPFDVTICPAEVLEKNHITEKADVYSFALIMWEMYTRVRPFKNQNPRWVAERVIHDNLRPSLDNTGNWDPNYVQLMKDCWEEDYTLRPTFDVILQRIESIHSHLFSSPCGGYIEDFLPENAQL